MKLERNIKNKYYDGQTLIETLMTLVIVGIIIVVISSTLALLIKASAISAARTLTREESEFVLELMEKELSNSKSEDVELYSSSTPDKFVLSISDSATVTHAGANLNLLIVDDTPAIQVHTHPITSDGWTCIGLYQYDDPESDEVIGVLVKASLPEGATKDANCITSADSSRVLLSSLEVDIEEFQIRKFDAGGENVTFVIDMTMKPLHWIPGKQSRYKAEYIRQLIVTTEKLTY